MRSEKDFSRLVDNFSKQLEEYPHNAAATLNALHNAAGNNRARHESALETVFNALPAFGKNHPWMTGLLVEALFKKNKLAGTASFLHKAADSFSKVAAADPLAAKALAERLILTAKTGAEKTDAIEKGLQILPGLAQHYPIAVQGFIKILYLGALEFPGKPAVYKEFAMGPSNPITHTSACVIAPSSPEKSILIVDDLGGEDYFSGVAKSFRTAAARFTNQDIKNHYASVVEVIDRNIPDAMTTAPSFASIARDRLVLKKPESLIQKPLTFGG